MGDHQRPADSRKILDALVAAAVPGDTEWLSRAREARAESGIAVFSEILRDFSHVRLGEREAEELWPSILSHWRQLSESLGRDVGLFVAIIDWFTNVDLRIKEPTAMERSQLEKTERSAMTDWLTGLYNRGAFHAAAQRELRRAQRYRQQLSLMMLDLDDFKRVNDRFGHDRGDQVLRDVSRLLRRTIRDIDVAARYGGEEFAILLPETGRLGARAVAERVRSAVGKQGLLRDSDETDTVTVSAGIAVYPEDCEELAELLRQADVALYRAKAAGKNTVVSEFEERRLARRVSLNGARARVAVRAGRDRRTLLGAARDISRTGVGLTLSESCDVGQALELSLEGPGAGASRNLTGRVVRYREVRGGSAGLAFDIGVALDEESERSAEEAIEASQTPDGAPADPKRSATS